MSLEIVNKIPLLIQQNLNLDISTYNNFGWGNPVCVLRNGEDSQTHWRCYDVGDTIDMRAFKAYVAENPNTIKLWVYHNYGRYFAYSGLNTATYLPDYIPRAIVDHFTMQPISQSKGEFDEMEEKRYEP